MTTCLSRYLFDSNKIAVCASISVILDFFSDIAVMGMGQYDTLSILEAPDDEAMAKAALAISSLGNVRTKTHRAFTEAEYKRIIAALP